MGIHLLPKPQADHSDPQVQTDLLPSQMTRCEFENFESKLNELMKTCLEMDQLNVGLQDLKPGSRAYEQVLSQIECEKSTARTTSPHEGPGKLRRGRQGRSAHWLSHLRIKHRDSEPATKKTPRVSSVWGT
ncbi:MAG: hypothetical protein DMG21_12295 [Acidobacteria bacterium]|nr:MAG: hypothetical protein DMG21_12295 [Acidobacteriota bacterium]